MSDPDYGIHAPASLAADETTGLADFTETIIGEGSFGMTAETTVAAVIEVIRAADQHRGSSGPGHLGCTLCQAVDALRSQVGM